MNKLVDGTARKFIGEAELVRAVHHHRRSGEMKNRPRSCRRGRKIFSGLPSLDRLGGCRRAAHRISRPCASRGLSRSRVPFPASPRARSERGSGGGHASSSRLRHAPSRIRCSCCFGSRAYTWSAGRFRQRAGCRSIPASRFPS